MSDKIKDALNADFIARLQDWARGREVATSASSWPSDGPIGGIGSGSKFHTHRIPPMLGRVHDTDMAIGCLPNRYRQAVQQFWMFEGLSLREHGRRRQIDYHTFETWVLKGHELLKCQFAVRNGHWARAKAAARSMLVTA